MTISPFAASSGAAAYSAASALQAFGQGMNASAHNIANINTAGFDPLQVGYETGPQGQGVRVSSIEEAALPFSDRVNGSATAADAVNRSFVVPPEALDSSNTELSREFSTMIATQRAYEANAVSVQTWDAMLGTLVDIRA
ncbi:MAG: flagellar basal body rod C-terminal domain-containing protein [Desulfovibrionaceae bacterium]